MNKEQEMKKYCDNCKYFKCFKDYGLNGCTCEAPNNITEIGRYWGVEKLYIAYPQDKNKNNNCEDYKPSWTYKTLKFLKLKD